MQMSEAPDTTKPTGVTDLCGPRLQVFDRPQAHHSTVETQERSFVSAVLSD
jgi:hypothetical protein